MTADPAAAGPHQAHGQDDDPDGQNQVDNTGSQAEPIGVVPSVEVGDQSDHGFGGDQQLSQAPAAPFLRCITEDPDEGEPSGGNDKENDGDDQVADTVATGVVASGYYRVQPIGDTQQTEDDKLHEGNDAYFVSESHTGFIINRSLGSQVRKSLQNKHNRVNISLVH
jgi:hypothetical protein